MALWADGRRGKEPKEPKTGAFPISSSSGQPVPCLSLYSFFLNNHTAKQYSPFGTFPCTSVTWQESSCRMKHLPVTNKLQLQGFLLLSSLWQPVSICSSNLTCLLTHRRLCWIEQRNYVALSLCWLLRQLGWAHSVLHCQSTLMSKLVPVPSEIWQRLEPTTAFDWLSR